MTFKKKIDDSEATRKADAEAAESERAGKAAELVAIADRLEKHLSEQQPSEVGLELSRRGTRLELKSIEFAILINAGFKEYDAIVVSGHPPQPARGSRQKLATLDDVDAYVLGVLQQD
jgi:hypothetical protein